MKHSLYVAALIAAALVPASRDAAAGHQQASTVYINTTTKTAYGDLSAARNSSDTTQYIGCNSYSFSYTGAAVYTVCVAVDAAGVSASCVTSDPEMHNIATGLNGDDWLRFVWDSSTGQCTQLGVNKNSYIGPKL